MLGSRLLIVNLTLFALLGATPAPGRAGHRRQPAGRRSDQGSLCSRACRPGRPAGPATPLRGLWLAGHRGLLCRGAGDRQAAGLRAGRAHDRPPARDHLPIRRPGLSVELDAEPRGRSPRSRCRAPLTRSDAHQPTTRGRGSSSHKYLDWNTRRVRSPPRQAGRRQRPGEWLAQTLDGSLSLIDPVWGGAYQYSTHGDWRHIHFEKIMQVQAETYGSMPWPTRRFGDAALPAVPRETIHRYVRDISA